MYEVRSETKLAFRVVESLFRFVSLCTDFPDRLVVNWAYSFRRRRVRLVNSPDRLVVIRLVATEFVSSTRETDSSRITPLRLVKCRVRLVELCDRLVVDQFHLQISKKYRSWEGPRMVVHLFQYSLSLIRCR